MTTQTENKQGNDNKNPAGDAGNAPQGQQPQGQQPQGQQAGQQPAASYRPEGLADHLYGTSDQETIDKLYKAYGGARSELAGKRGIPEKIDEYTIALPDELAQKVLRPGEDGKDPFFEKMRGIFHENLVPQEVGLKIVQQIYEAAEGAGGGSDPADWEFKSMGGKEKAQAEIDGGRTFITGLKNSGKLSEAAANELDLLTYHGQGLTLIRELRTLLGDKSVPANLSKEGTATGEVTEEILNQRVADKRYNRKSKDFDQAFFDETTRMFENFYNKPAA